MKKFLVITLILLTACAILFTGCTKKKDAEITLKMGDCHPDRNGGVGFVLDKINTEFLMAHQGVSLTVESYQDQPWQEKARIYATANQLPDVFKWWTFPNMIGPFVKAGQVEKLNKSDFSGFGYLPGALESCEYEGNLYGVPASGDMWVIYVNKDLFAKAGVALPLSWEDIIAAVPRFKERNITPLVTNGLEGWPLSIFFDNILQRINGDFTRNYNAIDRIGGVKFTDPDFIQAAAYVQNLVKADVFNPNLTISDYGDAQNQFVQERAAMYMMGSWEMGMAANPGFSESFRNNLDVIKFPVIQGGKGTADDPMVWFGGNFVVSANSRNKALAVEYLKFLAERFGSYCWDSGAGFPAQKVTPKASDSDVSKKLLQFSAEAKSISGKAPGLDYGKTNAFKEEHQELIRQLCAQIITPEVFCQRLDAAAEQDSKQ
ncbi:MAG: extracellular solute-binding protein [Treponema sp.]|jgi:raffinose/stachyose/melibiose transport system substrate-binding protein|nr:extracellular solute-binding protein [Treponema sp.]